MQLAVIKTGGKQYKVSPGQKIKIEKLDGKEGDTVVFDVLLSAGGDKLEIGQPLAGVKATGKILEQDRAQKVTIMKYKSKKRYHVKRGHRQPFSLVEIESIK